MTIDYMYNMYMRLEMVSRVDCLVYGFLGCALLTNDHISNPYVYQWWAIIQTVDNCSFQPLIERIRLLQRLVQTLQNIVIL